MGEGQHDRERAVEQKIQRMLGQVDVLQKRIEHAVAAEDRLPCVGTDQVADPERNDHELIEKVFRLPAWKDR